MKLIEQKGVRQNVITGTILVIMILFVLIFFRGFRAEAEGESDFVSITEITWFNQNGKTWYMEVFFEYDSGFRSWSSTKYRKPFSQMTDISDQFMEKHRVAYCVESVAANPSGYTGFTEGSLLNSEFSKTQQALLANILKNGYPANKAYWKKKGLSYLEQAACTQLAIWSITDEWKVSSYTGVQPWDAYTSSNAVMQEMYEYLYRCGKSTQESTVEPKIVVKADTCLTETTTFSYKWNVSATGCEWGTQLKFSELPTGAEVYVDGSKISGSLNQILVNKPTKTYSVILKVPIKDNMKKSIRLTAEALVPNTSPVQIVFWSTKQQGTNGLGQQVKLQNMIDSITTVIKGTSSYASVESEEIISYGGWLVIHKKHDTKPLQNAVYGVFTTKNDTSQYAVSYVDEECTIVAQANTTLVTDEQGYARSGFLKQGTYYVKELEAPEGYCLDETFYEITIVEKDGIELELQDDVITGSVEIVKTDAESPDTLLSGAVFELLQWESETNSYVVYPALDENGNDSSTFLTEISIGVYRHDEIKWSESNQGKFLVREVTAPKGYVNNGWEQEFIIEDDNQNFEFKCENPKDYIEILIKKSSEQGVLEDVTFMLYKASAIDEQTECFLHNGTSYYYQMEADTDADGSVSFAHLERGIYLLVEKRTNPNHSLLSEPIIIDTELKDEENPLILYEIDVSNESLFSLPFTGGKISFVEQKIGLLMVLIGLLFMNKKLLRRNYEENN